MRPRLALCCLLTFLAALLLPACGSAGQTVGDARAQGGRLALAPVGRFDHPVYVAAAPGYRQLLFVVEQPGRVEVLRHGHRLAQPFLDLRSKVGYDGGERGLLSIAFPPDYRTSRRFYVYYVNRKGNIRVDEFRRRTPTRAAPASPRRVIEIPHPVNANHNGGQLQFLGNLLYFGTGDGGSGGDPPNNAQNTRRPARQAAADRSTPARRPALHGPRLNPFVGRPRARRDLQLRPAQPVPLLLRHGERPAPRIAIGDVGQDRFEELDYTTVAARQRRQLRLGRARGILPYPDENGGTPDPGGTGKPVFAYPHSRAGSCSIIGGYVVADRRLRSLYGRYVYADLCEGQLRSLVPQPAPSPRRPQARARRLLPHLLRRRRRPPALRRLARRPGLPHRRMLGRLANNGSQPTLLVHSL